MTGRDRNPSAPAQRLPVVVLALAGCAVSTYLALYQYEVLGSVWDPFFGDGSRKVLTSALSRSLPVRDAALGAAAYLFEAVLEASGGRHRRRERPWLVLLVGAVAAALAVTGIVLTVAQPVLTGTFCTLCLSSAAISILVAVLVGREAGPTLHLTLRQMRDGTPLRQAVQGPGRASAGRSGDAVPR
ncbi:vitamin K epoxide reductase family protein [Actinomadura gamaensis]|uniref:Vitamin K epoxide reductase family protein n=1 Tax=Actinomadura gamaensis TaxID=1763541 RepID=A0ABV9TZ81_9ACTN